ncbi:MAG: hypothetical protein O3A53_06790 [Acidobacteria bacterium]|nr:hypothetical protein [Acidobacteriota bacterium]
MNRLGLWLVDKLSLALEPNERDAVRGDQAELRRTGLQAVCEVCGLIIRRQLQAWKDWRPWLAVLSGVGPCLVLAALNLQLAHMFAPSSPAGLLHWGDASYSGLIFFGAVLLLGGLGSWACGFVVSSFSQRARVVNFGFFFLAWLFALTLGLINPRFQKTWDEQPGRLLIAVVFHLMWFAAPAFAGLLRGRKSQFLTFSGAVRLAALLCLPIIATVVAVATVDRGRGEIGFGEILMIAFLSALHAWPSAPIILRSLFSRRIVARPAWATGAAEGSS